MLPELLPLSNSNGNFFIAQIFLLATTTDQLLFARHNPCMSFKEGFLP